MPDERDKVTVGVTREGAASLAGLMESRWFDDEVDAYRVAISTAIGAGIDVSAVALTGVQTKYNVGSLDRDGSIAAMIRSMVPGSDARPYDYAERLADAGLRYLKIRVVDQGMLLAEALGHSARD